MNSRKLPVAFVLFLAVGLASCGTMRRAGKDLGVVVLSPAIALYGGGTDGVAEARNIREGLGGSTFTEVLVLPPAFVYHTLKHVVYAAIHAVDFALFPAYGLAELHPYGPEIEPLDYYTGTIFDEDPDEKSGTDAESGEERRD